MRELFDHKVTTLNRTAIEVHALDERDADGANHKYGIVVTDTSKEAVDNVVLKFQKGGLKEVGPNGITDQALLAIVIDRMNGFQQGPFSSRENAIAITHLETAMLWMGKRASDRAARGVEGERVA